MTHQDIETDGMVATKEYTLEELEAKFEMPAELNLDEFPDLPERYEELTVI